MFSFNKVFREEAVARRSRPEPLDERLQVTAPHEWIVLAALGVALIVFLAWAVFARVDRNLTAAAVLVQPGARDAVVSPVSGSVIETLAEVGDPVEQGQRIARVRLPEAERQARITRTIVSAVEEGMRGVESADEVRGPLLAAARDELRDELAAVELRAGEWIVAPRAGALIALSLTAGQPVSVGETVARVRGSSADAWQGFAFVSPQDAERIEPGMDAEVLTRAGQPGEQRLEALVLDVSVQPVTAPVWLADLGLTTPAPAHLLRVTLNEPLPETLADGTAGRVRITVGRQSPAALLAGRGS